jgi:hypothetical protein
LCPHADLNKEQVRRSCARHPVRPPTNEWFNGRQFYATVFVGGWTSRTRAAPFARESTGVAKAKADELKIEQRATRKASTCGPFAEADAFAIPETVAHHFDRRSI